MQTFSIARHEEVDFPSVSPIESSGVCGLRTPGFVVLILQHGSGWVMREDGTRAPLTSQSVVIWEPGDWMEYGGNPSSDFIAETYWSHELSEDEWSRRMDEFFGG
jgi:hypothetical protein